MNESSSQRKLEGQVAWISGASSGIGLATALLFAQHGASVVLAARRGAACQALAEQIRGRGGTALATPCDVADERQVRTSLEETQRAFGPVQILINNAGIVDVRALHEYDSEQWDHVFAVNVKSVFYAFKHAYTQLRRHRRSYIVNVGSISSFVGQALTPVYTTTKHALLGLTRSIALDYATDGVRCNCVCPGITDTAMLREHLDATGDPEGTLSKRLQRVPMGVALTPDDVARSILFFACDDSAGVTGTSLVVDCGYLTAAEWSHPGHTAFMEPS